MENYRQYILITSFLIVFVLFTCTNKKNVDSWLIDSQEDWLAFIEKQSDLEITNGKVVPSSKKASFTSTMKQFTDKRSIKSITFFQSPEWQNWNEVKPIGPTNLGDAPVFLSLGPKNYWIFGRYTGGQKKKEYNAKPAELEGIDVPLLTTPFPNQFDAPGGLKPQLGGYHAWQSCDMVNWVHHGPVTEKFSCWVTTAEHIDGKTYIYYDYPNDQDPHVYVDEDLTDGLPGKNMGMAFKDPSHGSDCAFFRDSDGSFHVIYEDWSPINAAKHAWDSPLAGHAVSPDGLGSFEIKAPAIDHRTTPTGNIKTYKHPYWAKHPDWDTNIGEYEEHLPIQDAYGDWCMIKVGGQYYLFGDYDHAEHSFGAGHPKAEAQANMSIARFTSNSLNEEFELVGDYGKTGHPDPDIGFAEGQFYLITQSDKDFVSPGPWVETVIIRAGVDSDGDSKIDKWTDWQEVSEQYMHTEGYAKIVETIPAQMELSGLPEGYGFQFEFKIKDATANESKPILDKVELLFTK
ncbi:MAG: hypothetical protein AAFO07_00240 [Bacteroidota bacterium]